MNTEKSPSVADAGPTNGSGAAAILAAGMGAFVLGVVSIAADRIPSFHSLMVFYKPTGPLSGVTTLSILIWLVAWSILEWRWRHRNVAIGRSNAIALILLGLSLLLTFPPLADLF